ncbi:MAG: hypothetical protein KTR24_11645 [Saprospiraceae bacterium]|nr:hypothetical protein [Saprospiraceae bacterium]
MQIDFRIVLHNLLVYRLGFVLLMAMVTLPGLSQDDTALDSLREIVREQSGLEKMQSYVSLADINLDDDPSMALRDARRAERMMEDLIPAGTIDKDLISTKVQSNLVLARVFEARNYLADAQNIYSETIGLAAQIGDQETQNLATENLSRLSTIKSSKRGKVGNFVGGVFSKSESGIQDIRLMTALKAATYNEKKNNYAAAIKHLEKAASRLRDKGEDEALAEVEEKIATFEAILNPPPAAPETPVPPPPPEESLDLYSIDDSLEIAAIDAQIATITAFTTTESETAEANEMVEDAAVRAIVLEEANNKSKSIQENARRAEQSRDLEGSLNYYKQYLALEQQLMEEQRIQDSTMAQIKLLRETNELQAQVSEEKLQRQLSAKRSMAGGLGLVGALAASLLILYRNKRRDHTRLTTAYDDLESTQKELRTSQQRVRDLLKQHVSGAVADELLAAKADNKVERKFVCIMFLDIRDFTPFAENHNPEEIIEYQNNVFGFMIEIINQHGGIVNQILGDGFMSTFGAPVSSGNDCLNAYDAARKIIAAVREKSRQGLIPETKVGIGLHAGNVVAGNVGTEQRKQYSITGNPVIIASRLEQLNKEFGSSLVISKEVHSHIPEASRPEAEFVEVEVKGRSEPVEVMKW